jgi:DNA-binding GntR family transcriptional regulator
MAAEHQSLLDVIEAGDVETAVGRMTAHLERAVHDLTPSQS